MPLTYSDYSIFTNQSKQPYTPPISPKLTTYDIGTLLISTYSYAHILKILDHSRYDIRCKVMVYNIGSKLCFKTDISINESTVPFNIDILIAHNHKLPAIIKAILAIADE